MKPSLISIHIPKTAGQTLRHLLELTYGKDQVLNINRGRLERQGKALVSLHPEQYHVLHGHLPYRAFISPYHDSETQLITFLRDPVERVLSNFRYYRKKKRQSGLKPAKPYATITTWKLLLNWKNGKM
jgi:hypothetical protein